MKRVIRNGTVLYRGKLQKLDILFDEESILEIGEHIE